MQNTVNEAGNERGSVTISLPDCARQLARLRPHYPPEVGFHISNLIERCRNYQYNPEGLRPLILKTIDRLTALNAEERQEGS